MTTSLDPARPLGSMTIGEFLEMFDEHLHATNLQTAHVQTGSAPTTVHRKLKKAEQLGYKPSSGTQCPVPFHSGAEQAEQLNN